MRIHLFLKNYYQFYRSIPWIMPLLKSQRHRRGVNPHTAAVKCFIKLKCNLECEQEQEGHHQTEETHGLRQGKTQDGIGEQLLFQRGVPGIANDK